MKYKGFTLVELLAVIVILAIILAIAIPGISGIISSASSSSFESDAKMLLKAVDYKLLQDETFDVTTINETNVNTLLNINGSNYERLNVKKINGIVYATIVGKGKWNNLTVSGTKEATKVVDTVTSLVRGANAPVLATGMTPIKWNGTTWVDTTSDDVAWYNYDTTNKIWANAKTADGSMWVWIPRYIYKISTGWHTNTAGTIDIQFSKGIDDNWNKSIIGNIDLGETANASNNKWTTHPAFTFGNTELTGFWMAKFEASSPTDSECYLTNLTGVCNITTMIPMYAPNLISWRRINDNNIFIVTKAMETNNVYGWGTTGNGIDTHMMKNTELGAITYLAQSIYGKNAKIWINPADNYTTGCAGDSATSALTTGCLRTYDTANGQQTSTTGNIYGVYDMAGGAWEKTAAYLNNGHDYLTTYSLALLTANNKYKDVYAVGAVDNEDNNYALTINHKGDALYETSNASTGTSSWYSDNSYIVNTTAPTFNRGGGNNGVGLGIFSFDRGAGGTGIGVSFRAILLVDNGV